MIKLGDWNIQVLVIPTKVGKRKYKVEETKLHPLNHQPIVGVRIRE